jgi:hypothetical protein
LRLGRGTVDLVGEDDVGEDRTLDEFEIFFVGVHVDLQNFGAEDVTRHQVGSELNAVEFQVENAGNRADEQGFGKSRHTDQQTVTLAEEGDDQLLDHILLAYNDFANFSFEGFVFFGERIGCLLIVFVLAH